MQAIGLCRFSYPALGGFQVEHETVAAREAYLYDPARLDERFRLFECVALPCLRAQTDPDFHLVVLVGDTFPDAYARRLEALLEDLPQAIVHREPPRKQREVMKEILNDARIHHEDPCLQFRFDDDDAVSTVFIEKLRRAAADCAGLLRGERSVAFDWNRGYAASFDADGVRAAEIYRPFYVAALGMLIKGGSRTSVMNFNHDRIPQFMPTVSFSEPGMFVRGHNAFNDSRQNRPDRIEMASLTASEETLFRARFNIDADRVRRVFGAADAARGRG